MLIEGCCADRAEFVILVRDNFRRGSAFALALLGALELFRAPFGVKIRLVHHFDIVQFAESLRAITGHHHVLGLLHDHPCQIDGVFCVFHTRYGTNIQGRSVHNRCIELVRAVVGKNCTFAGIKQRRIFHDIDSGLDGVHAGAAGFENGEYADDHVQ